MPTGKYRFIPEGYDAYNLLGKGEKAVSIEDLLNHTPLTVQNWIHDLGRTIDSIASISIHAEIRELKPDGAWKKYECGDKTLYEVKYRDGFSATLHIFTDGRICIERPDWHLDHGGVVPFAEPLPLQTEQKLGMMEAIFKTTNHMWSTTVYLAWDEAKSITIEETDHIDSCHAEALAIGMLWQEHTEEIIEHISATRSTSSRPVIVASSQLDS